MSDSKIIQIGNLARDPELKFTNGGKAVVQFPIATNFKYGEKEEACFIDVTFWEKSAESVNKFFKKGDAIIVEGELRQQNWEDEKGKHSKHIIRGTLWGFPPRGKNSDGDSGAQATTATAPEKKPADKPPSADEFPEDIPF